MAVYIKTEHFFKREVEAVSDILRARGYKEEWSIITPYQAEIKMFHVFHSVLGFHFPNLLQHSC